MRGQLDPAAREPRHLVETPLRLRDADVIEQLPFYSDEPSADAGAVPVFFLSRMCRSQVTVALSGECDLACRQELTAALQDAVSTARVVAVDLAGVRFLDSSGLHCLVVAYQKAVAEGKVLYATGATGAVSDNVPSN